MKPLNAKLELFAQVWARTDNKTEAYRQMLPKSKALSASMNTRAGNISRREQVRARYLELIEINQEIAEKDYRISEARVLQEIARLAFNDPRNCFDSDGNLLDIKDWPAEVAATISSIKIVEKRTDDDVVTEVKEIKFWDKGRQIELAAKNLGMLIDKKEILISNPADELTKLKQMADDAIRRD